MTTDQAKAVISAKNDDVRHSFEYTVSVSINALKQDGLYDAYLTLRPDAATLPDDTYDVLTILQAQIIGLI